MNCLYQSKRISDLKEKMLSSKRYASIDQARIITRVYQENEDVSIPKKREMCIRDRKRYVLYGKACRKSN